jgi:hypothetical protein
MSRRAHGHNAISGGCLVLVLAVGLALVLAALALSDIFQRLG